MTSISTEHVALDDLADHVELYRVAKAQIKDWEDTAARARAVIEERLGECEVGTIADHAVLRWAHLKRTALDQKLCKQLYPAVYAECMASTGYRRLELVDPS